jgi:protein tyrosine/serine phosphatase
VQVYPEFLDAAFDEIRDRCGSVDRYLEDVLGVDAGVRARIHDRVLG